MWTGSAAAPVLAKELEEPAFCLLRSDLGRVPPDLRLVRPPDVDHTAVLGQDVAGVELGFGLAHCAPFLGDGFGTERTER
jgi:hypothetical protein